MRILGIDPGVATTGWAILDIEEEISVVDFGVISTRKETEHSVRLTEIYSDMKSIIDKFSPEYAGVELLLFTNNAKTAMKVGESRGVILLVLSQNDIPVIQFTPLQIKLSIAGNGRADKRQVQENVKSICKMKELPKPDDAADAVAIAICCYDSIKMSGLISKNSI